MEPLQTMTDKEEALELYKTYVDTITANEQRRQQLAAFYLSLVAAGIALLGTIKGIDPLAVLGPMFVIAAVWYATIRYFRRLAQAKFKVIAELESHFTIRPFQLEHRYYKSKSNTDELDEKTAVQWIVARKM